MFGATFHDQLRTQNHISLLPINPISDGFLADLITEIDNEHLRGIILGGSHARGDATPYSDVDLACFVMEAYQPRRKRYQYSDNHLISIGFKTLEGNTYGSNQNLL
jgi:hypothetical protein